ncbi:unnamed protein product [Mytilus edulis]|uniref:DDE Tnp4 domain-containing protein n=1 Tax=Mytilus edulis TaxID=6550 RepID=A0A8S3V7U2_MYTED|nr:unnamed protein product [Mytilus edulis]
MDYIDVAAVVNIFFLDDVNEQVCVQICDMINELISVISGMLPREEVPKITNFSEITVPRFASRDFRQHFRIDRSTFDIILQSLAPSFIYAHTGGKEQVTVEKQLMLFIWYMANKESMREISHIFGISLSTFHSTILRVVVDDNLMITSAQTGWPGCAHDARVLRNTELFTKAEAGNLTAVNNHLLGDSAYPLKNRL